MLSNKGERLTLSKCSSFISMESCAIKENSPCPFRKVTDKIKDNKRSNLFITQGFQLAKVLKFLEMERGFVVKKREVFGVRFCLSLCSLRNGVRHIEVS